MAKKIVKVNEEEIRGYMVGDIPDAIEKDDVIVEETPSDEADEPQGMKKSQPRKDLNPAKSVSATAVSVRSIL